jgi:hypothetical protein
MVILTFLLFIIWVMFEERTLSSCNLYEIASSLCLLITVLKEANHICFLGYTQQFWPFIDWYNHEITFYQHKLLSILSCNTISNNEQWYEVLGSILHMGYSLPLIIRTCIIDLLTSHIRWSEYSFSGSRFPLTVPSNMVGSCGMMLSLPRKSCNPILLRSTLSISIVPTLGSTIRKSAWIKVDFPLPVRPTIPTFFRPGIVHDIFLKTDGRWSAYRTCKSK